MFNLDFFAYNYDRHFNNMGLLIGNNTVSLAPIFDFGESLFKPKMYGGKEMLARPFGLRLESQTSLVKDLSLTLLKDPFEDIDKRIPFKDPVKTAYKARLKSLLSERRL